VSRLDARLPLYSRKENIMEVITMESETFKRLEKLLNLALTQIESIAKENSIMKHDRWMSAKEAGEYLGFKPQWIYKRKHELKASQKGTEVRFLRSETGCLHEVYAVLIYLTITHACYVIGVIIPFGIKGIV
jgi:CRISPR/Cas system-associated exonuclease Cas4 (RecB family)